MVHRPQIIANGETLDCLLGILLLERAAMTVIVNSSNRLLHTSRSLRAPSANMDIRGIQCASARKASTIDSKTDATKSRDRAVS